MITSGAFYSTKVYHMSLFSWVVIHHGSELRGDGVHNKWWENGAWVISVIVVVTGSLIKCFCS